MDHTPFVAGSYGLGVFMIFAFAFWLWRERLRLRKLKAALDNAAGDA